MNVLLFKGLSTEKMGFSDYDYAALALSKPKELFSHYIFVHFQKTYSDVPGLSWIWYVTKHDHENVNKYK